MTSGSAIRPGSLNPGGFSLRMPETEIKIQQIASWLSDCPLSPIQKVSMPGVPKERSMLLGVEDRGPQGQVYVGGVEDRPAFVRW
jgi:hypothetical protein